MKGRITRYNAYFSIGYITGEDGEQYFLHKSEMVNCKNIKSDNIVTFDSVDTGEQHFRAVNVRKIGHGKHHPFIQDLNRLADTLNSLEMDEMERSYRLKDIQMLINYFENVEDFEWCKDVRRFKHFKEYGNERLS